VSASGPAGIDWAGIVAPVVVACSGGADSLGLLVAACEVMLEPIAVHVDHGIRPGSEREADRVHAAAARLGARSHAVRAPVAPGSNLEARARDARYTVLEQARIELDATAVLVAHTADDQAETVLLNLLRGAAATGLAGMPARRGPVVRPALGVRRTELRALAAERGIVAFEDPSNTDLTHRRNWVRHEVLPRLTAGAARDLVPVLTRQASVLRAESELLDELADALLEAAGGQAPSARVLADAHPALARRAVRRWLGHPPPSLSEVERVLAIARNERRATELAGGRRVCRRAGVLHQEVPWRP